MNARKLSDLKIKIFADGADLAGIREMAANPLIKGFTTNPTLMRKAGVGDYKAFALDVLKVVPDKPISFEVFADDFAGMERQAIEIASWGRNVNVKIPITNTRGESSGPLVGRLSKRGITVNVTALFTLDQVAEIVEALDPATPAILSVFAGRVADSGRDPVPHMQSAVEIAKARPKAEVLWASPRELLNILQADAAGCHIITATNDILRKLAHVGKDLETFSRETVRMFHDDARAAGYQIATGATAKPSPRSSKRARRRG
jgi:transaldolase